MLLFKKLIKVLFDVVISKTPESWRPLRNLCVRTFCKWGGRNISIGRNCRVHRNTVIGNNSGIGYGCEVNNGVTIGENVMMGPEVLIYTQNHYTANPNMPMRMQGMTEIKPVIIEDDVWIGARVCILPGVTVGKGSILGACAVVARNVPPYSVAVGNPARVVKTRVSNKTNK